MNRLKIIAFTHKSTELSNLGRFYIEEPQLKEKLSSLKEALALDEIFYLSTCNRVEILISSAHKPDVQFIHDFFHAFNPSWSEAELHAIGKQALVFEGEEALKHILHVTSSLDSLVVGEREIITQVRKAYETCSRHQLTGDFFRLVMNSTVKTAKEIFTDTQIASKPVSVVSLAYRKLRDLDVKLDARFLIIGSGQTNSTMAKYLLKHGFRNFTVFNRTLKNAEVLAAEIKGVAMPLNELKNHRNGFDVIITCTGSSEPIITRDLYTALVGKDDSRKIIVDLAIPNDTDQEVIRLFNIHYIEVETLKTIAEDNLKEREKELELCHTIVERNMNEFRQTLKQRKVELAMKEVPEKIKEIKHTAMNSVFAKDLEQMDEPSRQILENILAYVEKKYISVPMKLAKEILLEEGID